MSESAEPRRWYMAALVPMNTHLRARVEGKLKQAARTESPGQRWQRDSSRVRQLAV